MKIKWFGQSCFFITTDDGTRVLIDPYYRLLGYRMPVVESDIVIVTHDHKDHNQIQAASGDYLLVNTAGEHQRGRVSITGVPTFHDKKNGAKRGNNLVFVIRTGDLTVCHCGDLGHLLTPQQVQDIGPVDILMVPVGGSMTINGPEAVQVMEQLKPAVSIPMHYRTKQLGFPVKLLFAKVEKFLAASGQDGQVVQELNVTKATLDQWPKVITFEAEQTR